MLKEKLPEQNKSKIISNLKRNFYFPLSALIFFILISPSELVHSIGVLISAIALIVITSQIPSGIAIMKQVPVRLHVITAMTTLGICWYIQKTVYGHLYMEDMFSTTFYRIISIYETAFVVFFVYFCVLIFWKEMTRIFSESNIFRDINKAEAIVYGILIIASLTFMAVSFAQTEAFYGTEYKYDIIYTSDSPHLVKDNVYMNLIHEQNDIRQPLFAVFAAPFVGIPYLLGNLTSSASIHAMMLNSVQVVMMFAANFMLAKMMKLNSVKRICFMLLTSFTYTQLLFTLMMEQYMVAYFWLIFCVYNIVEKQKPDRLALWGAGGTLLTSMLLLLFASDKNPIKNFKKWFAEMMRYGLEFVAVILVFCRFDVIFNLISRIKLLSIYTGKTVSFTDKLYQYTAFIPNCFVSPDAAVKNIIPNYFAFHVNFEEHLSWQLKPVTSINFIGVALILLSVIGAVLNREKKSSMIAAVWVAFSVVMLLILGWGTAENGLILYSLYFGWAFLVLLFQLVEKLEDKLKVKFLVPSFSIVGAAVLAIVNIPGIMDMLDFAITNFPT